MLIAISAVAVVQWRRRPYLLVGWLWYLGTMLPVIGLVQVGEQAMADRYTYLPLVGPCIAVVWGIADVCRFWPLRRWLCGLSAALALVVLMGCGWRQTSFWRDSESLWTRELSVTPPTCTAYLDLGTYYLEKGRLDEAVAALRKGLQIKPDYPKTHNALGLALARRRYRPGPGALPSGPGYVARLSASQLQSRHWPGPGRTAGRGHRPLSPRLAEQSKLRESAVRLGAALAERGCFDAGIVELQAVLKANPSFSQARHNLGALKAQRDKLLDALAGQRALLNSRPDDLVLLNEVAWTLATNPNRSIRNGAEAVELAEREARLSGGRQPAVLDTLAAAYAEAGRFPRAVETAEKALELAARQDKAALAASLRARIKLYRAGSPYHQR